MIFISSKITDGNMSLVRGKSKESLANRKRFFKNLGINPKNVAEVIQTHSNKVTLIKNAAGITIVADGMITDRVDVYLMVKTADCIPLSLYDPNRSAIGLIHVGWRGLEKEIIKIAIQKMIMRFNSQLQDLIVRFGPSIGPCCYRMDIWKEAKKQLKENGILEKNINNPKICTYHTNEYFSHKKAMDKKQNDLRFVTILGLK